MNKGYTTAAITGSAFLLASGVSFLVTSATVVSLLADRGSGGGFGRLESGGEALVVGVVGAVTSLVLLVVGTNNTFRGKRMIHDARRDLWCTIDVQVAATPAGDAAVGVRWRF